MDGFLASRASPPNAPLYCVMSEEGRLVCLASDDNGETWYDYAVHEFRFNPYSFGGARELTADGQIVGAVTDFRVTSEDVDESQVHFIRIQAGLSRARIARMDFADGVFSAEFEQIRGQPQQVRFRTGEWGGWMPFEQRLEMDAARAPDQFQLRSRLGVESEIFDVGVATAIEEGLAGPSTFALDPNYPNPFNSGTVMRFSLPIGGHVDLSLYNLAGQKVTTLVEGRLEAGVHSLRWDGRDKGRELASGVYLYRLQAGGQVETRRLLMLR